MEMERIALVKVTDRRKGSMARICPGGDCHLCLNQRASAINVYDYGLGSGRFTLHMCCTLHMIPAIARDGN